MHKVSKKGRFLKPLLREGLGRSFFLARLAYIHLQALHFIFSWLPRKEPVLLHPDFIINLA